MRDLFNKIKVDRLFDAVAAVTDNTAAVSQIINLAGYESCVFVLEPGTLTDADATFDVLLEESNDAALATKNAVAAKDLQIDPLLDATITGTGGATGSQAAFQFDDDNERLKIGYLGGKQYVRITVTPFNNTGNFFLAGSAVKSNARHQPAGVTQTP